MPLRLNRNAYRVGWICPMEVEHTAAVEMLDEEHDTLPVLPGDDHVYNLGSINGQNIVIVGLPRVGNNYAATAVAQMRMTFPSLRYALVVGIGGGVPVKTEHGMIRLGHVVVGEPIDIQPGAVQYDHGRWTPGQFERKGSLSPPPTALLSAAQELARHRNKLDLDPVWANLKKIPTDRPAFRRYKFPGIANDHLYQPDCVHQVKGVSCEESGCDPQKRIKRPLGEQGESFVVVHRGTIATGELVMKDAKRRNELAQEHKALCFETEAAGALTNFPCLVIRGISDYCDTHKNDVWHGYAAAVAAAYARQLFYHMSVEETQRPEIETELSGLRITPQSPRIEGTLNGVTKADHQSRFHIVPSLWNRHFTGRETTLEELQQRLFIQADTPILALFGLGGIGKTQVALQLANWVEKQMPEFSVFWVPALSLQTFEQACSQIVKKIGIQQHPDDERESAMELVHEYLSSNAAGKWLFIVDNADDLDLLFNDLEQYFPASENGVTLLTTRSREVAVTFATTDIVELENMTLAEGEDFLAKIVRKDLLCGPESTTQLLEELVYLPLAIVQAAFYMSHLSVKVSKYLEIMHSTEKDRADLASRDFHDRTRYRSMPNAVVTTWTISFKQIKNSEPSAAELLEFLSYIEPKAIPQSMLPTLESKENMERAIGILCSFAFLTKIDDGNAFDMHDLVQLATRRWVEDARHAQEVIQKVILRMDECYPSEENYSLEKCRAYLPHALKIIRRDESRGISERYSLLIKVGYFVATEGREKEALGFFEDASMWHESQHGEEHPDRQFSEHALANAYRSSGQAKNAVQILERVVTVRKRTAAEEDRSLLAYQYALAMAHQSSGHQIKSVVKMFEHVVTVHERTLDEENPDRLASQHALAKACRSDGQIKRAMQILEHVVTLRERKLSEEDHDLLSSQHSLAKTYKADGQIKPAMQILEHVVEIRKRTLDEGSRFLLSSQRALAKVYKLNNQIELAVEILEHVVTVQNKTLDDEDHDRLSSQHALAIAYRSIGQYELSVKLLENVVAVRKRMLGEEHPNRLASQHALGTAYHFNSQIEEAVQILEHVVTVRTRTLDEEHRHLLLSQHSLAMAYKSNGKIKLAVKILKHVVTVHTRTLDDKDPDRLASQKALANAKEKAKAKKEAKARRKLKKMETT